MAQDRKHFSHWIDAPDPAAGFICGRKNPHAPLFDSTRLSILFEKNLYTQGADVARRLVGDWLAPSEVEDASEVRTGEGKLLRRGPEKVAVYRDEGGALHAVSAVCTHLGCVVQWNAAEKSWDCPCHASRFGVDGEVLQGSAVKDLGRRNPG